MTVVCPTCGTELDVPETGPRCVVCGREIEALESRPSPPESSDSSPAIPEEAAAASGRDAAQMAAALPSGRKPTITAEHFEELRSGEKLYDFVTASVPIFGLFRLAESSTLSVPGKILAGTLSVALTVLVGIIGWEFFARSHEPVARRPEARIGEQIAAVADLVRRYEEQAGEPLDAETWELSVSTGESEFFDPWGNPLVYDRIDGGFRLGSFGEDGVPGGEGSSADRFEIFQEE